MGDQEKSTVGELFSGPGGMGYGLKEAGIEPVWAIDNDPEACRTYRRNVGGHVVCADIEGVDFRRFPVPGGLAFGFPCNDFSQVGEQRGLEGKYGKLYEHAVRALDELKPAWFIAENVPGMLQNGGGRILTEFAGAGLGYSVSVNLYRFEDYGVPQKRHRVIAVGIAEELGITFQPPVPTCEEPVTAEEALEGVEEVEDNNVRTNHPPHVVERLKHIPEGENAWHPDVPEELQLNVPNCRLSVIYRRLDRYEPAYTVTGSGGGGTHMYHYEEPRALTNRERARLQTFPDDFVFEGTKEGIRRQIGMAVPPRAAEQIGEALIKSLAGKDYSAVRPSIGVLDSSHKAPIQMELLKA